MAQTRRSGGPFDKLARLGRVVEARREQVARVVSDPDFQAGVKCLHAELEAKVAADRQLEEDARDAGVPERTRKLLMHHNSPERARVKVKATTRRHRGAHFRAALARPRRPACRAPRPRARRSAASSRSSGADPPGDEDPEPSDGLAGRRLTAGALA